MVGGQGEVENRGGCVQLIPLGEVVVLESEWWVVFEAGMGGRDLRTGMWGCGPRPGMPG